jgi:hypothetical protein
VFKIKYTLNLLALVGQHIDENGILKNSDVSFFDVCTGSEELDMF